MAWQEGNQKQRESKYRGINERLLDKDLGFIEEREAKLYLYNFLRENTTFAVDLLSH